MPREFLFLDKCRVEPQGLGRGGCSSAGMSSPWSAARPALSFLPLAAARPQALAAIKERPTLPHRGMSLDVSAHFSALHTSVCPWASVSGPREPRGYAQQVPCLAPSTPCFSATSSRSQSSSANVSLAPAAEPGLLRTCLYHPQARFVPPAPLSELVPFPEHEIKMKLRLASKRIAQTIGQGCRSAPVLWHRSRAHAAAGDALASGCSPASSQHPIPALEGTGHPPHTTLSEQGAGVAPCSSALQVPGASVLQMRCA